jgi:hypothetical protein
MLALLRRLGALRTAAALGVIGFTGVLPATIEGTSGSTDSQQIQQVIYAEHLEEQTCCLASPSQQSAVQPLPPQAIQQMQAHIVDTLGNLYTDNLLPDQVQLLQHAASVQGQGSIEVAGGVDSIKIRQLTVKGDTATATGEVTKWLKSLVKHGDGSSAPVFGRATNEFTYTLARTPSGWRISDESFSPAPGEGLG